MHAAPRSACTAAGLTYAPRTWLQALEEERLGPRREAYSDDRSMRLAVQEGATALVCSLMPAIEPVVLARARSLGQHCFSTNSVPCRSAGIGSFILGERGGPWSRVARSMPETLFPAAS